MDPVNKTKAGDQPVQIGQADLTVDLAATTTGLTHIESPLTLKEVRSAGQLFPHEAFGAAVAIWAQTIEQIGLVKQSEFTGEKLFDLRAAAESPDFHVKTIARCLLNNRLLAHDFSSDTDVRVPDQIIDRLEQSPVIAALFVHLTTDTARDAYSRGWHMELPATEEPPILPVPGRLASPEQWRNFFRGAAARASNCLATAQALDTVTPGKREQQANKPVSHEQVNRDTIVSEQIFHNLDAAGLTPDGLKMAWVIAKLITTGLNRQIGNSALDHVQKMLDLDQKWARNKTGQRTGNYVPVESIRRYVEGSKIPDWNKELFNLGHAERVAAVVGIVRDQAFTWAADRPQAEICAASLLLARTSLLDPPFRRKEFIEKALPALARGLASEDLNQALGILVQVGLCCPQTQGTNWLARINLPESLSDTFKESRPFVGYLCGLAGEEQFRSYLAKLSAAEIIAIRDDYSEGCRKLGLLLTDEGSFPAPAALVPILRGETRILTDAAAAAEKREAKANPPELDPRLKLLNDRDWADQLLAQGTVLITDTDTGQVYQLTHVKTGGKRLSDGGVFLACKAHPGGKPNWQVRADKLRQKLESGICTQQIT